MSLPPQLSLAQSGLSGGSSGFSPSAEETLVVIGLSDRLAALRAESVERIVLNAALVQPPGLPLLLEGILNLAGTAIPVLRLDRLLNLPDQHIGLYSMILILRCGCAILVDHVFRVTTISGNSVLPIAASDCFNACAEFTAQIDGEAVPLLSTERILLEKEKRVLSEFRETEQLRFDRWEGRA